MPSSACGSPCCSKRARSCILLLVSLFTDTVPALFLRVCFDFFGLLCRLASATSPQTMIMTTLDHPNVVKMYQAMTTISKVVIVMELVTGGELYHEILRHKRLTEDSARHYYRQLIEGLHHCHSHGVYHRDLKVRWRERQLSCVWLAYYCLHAHGESYEDAGVRSHASWFCTDPRSRRYLRLVIFCAACSFA